MGVDGSRAWSRRSPSASWKQRPAPGRADARLVVVGDPRHRGHRPVQEGPLHCRGRRHVLVSAQWGTGAGACATCRRSELAPLAGIWTRTSTKGSAASTALTDNVPHIRLCQNQSLYNRQVAVGCVPQQSEHMGLNLGHVLPIHLVRLNQLRGRDPRRRRQSCRPCRRRPKVNLTTERTQAPLAVAVRGWGRLPTGDEDAGTTAGAARPPGPSV